MRAEAVGVGGVTGVIQDIDSGAGVGNVVVIVAGRSATSQAPTGRFISTGIQPGPTFEPVLWQTVEVGIFTGYTTDYGVFPVTDRASLPPDP